MSKTIPILDLYMVITMKKTVLFLMVIFLMIGACGCGMRNTDEKKVIALNHIEDKYSGSFEVVSFTSRNIDMPYDEIVMMDRRGNKFFVYIEEDDNGNEIIQDGYYGVLKAGEYRETIENILDKYFTNYKFFSNFTASYFDNKYDEAYDLSEALRVDKTQFFSKNYVFVSEECLENMSQTVYEELSSEFESNGLSLYIAVYRASVDEIAGIDETKDVNLFLPDDYRVEPEFKSTIK